MIKQLWNYKTKAALLFVLCCSLNALAQTSAVSFTIQDPTGQVFSNGTLSYVIAPVGQYQFNGSPLSSSYYTPTVINLDSSGSGTISALPRNDYITPITSQWQFTACPNTSSSCTTVLITINQATQNISTVFNAQVPPIKISAAVIPRAYSDSEVQVSVAQGGMYYNTGLSTPGLRVWNGSGWEAVGGGSGGAVNLVENTDGTLIISPTTGDVVASLNLAHSNTWSAAQTFAAAILQGVAAGTSPVCPNGAGGSLTTTGCIVSGSGITQLTGDVTAGPGSGSQIATLASTGVTAGSYTNINATVDAKGRITSIANGTSNPGTVTNVSSSDSSLTVANPTSTPSVVINVNHINTWLAAQKWSDGGGTPDVIENYNDPSGSEGIYFLQGTTQHGGIYDNSAQLNLTQFDITGQMDFCDIVDCSDSFDMHLDLEGTGSDSPYASLRFTANTSTPFVINAGQGIWLGAQFATYLSNLSYQQNCTSITSAGTISLNAGCLPVSHITGAATINNITAPSKVLSAYTNTFVADVVADAAWSTTTTGNIKTAITATVGQMYLFVYDGSNWYILSPGAGSGLPCSGTCTASVVPIFGTGGTSVTNSHISEATNPGSETISQPVIITGSNQGFSGTGATLPSPVTSTGQVMIDSSNNVESSDNGGAFARVCNATNGICGTTVADFTVAISSGSQGATSCSSGTNVTGLTGLTTSMALIAGYSADPTSITSWSNGGGMTFYIWPSASGQATWKICNSLATTNSYGAITFNIGVK